MSGYRLEHHLGSGKRVEGRTLLLGEARGYLWCLRDSPTPRLAARIVRLKDGRVMDDTPASMEAHIGMVAGWPTWQQCVYAAARALRLGARMQRQRPDGSADLATRIDGLADYVEGCVPGGEDEQIHGPH